MERWEKINAVQDMQNYIEQHINEPITLSDLSVYAKYSPFHCARLFKELVGKTPFEYIRALRLSRAAVRLRDEDVRVLDVALDFVFDTHEGFTRAFSKEFGITPRKYSKNPPPIHLFMPSPVRDNYLTFQKGEHHSVEDKKTVNTVFVQVIERPQRKLILKRGTNANDYFEYCNDIGCDVWGLLCSVKEVLYEPSGMWLPDCLRTEGTSYYAQGVEVPAAYNGLLPDGLEIIDLPACKMMTFQGESFEDENYFHAVKEVSCVIETYNPEIYGFKWEDYDAPRFQLEPQGYRGYIEARPVRSL